MFLRIINIEIDSQKGLGRFEWSDNVYPRKGEYIDIPSDDGKSNHYLVVGILHSLAIDDNIEIYVQNVGSSQTLYSELRDEILEKVVCNH